MGLELDYVEGQSPVDEDEKEGLLIKTISTKGELDEFEQINIQQAEEWRIKTKFNTSEILSVSFILLVHKKMFNEVWKWAGRMRKTNKNIGVDKSQISIELKKLIDDCNYWIENKTFNADEIVIRFSHRLVTIHAFPNGNGRHSRLMADIMISNIFNKPIFYMGKNQFIKRQRYETAVFGCYLPSR